MAEKVDVVVVGGGPAGIACAYTLAKAGVETIVFERGEYPGAKNVMGGILFTNALAKIIPDFREKAPVERPVTKRKFLALSEKDALGVETGFSEFTPRRITIILRSCAPGSISGSLHRPKMPAR